MLPLHRPKTASGCCACSLRILRSRSHCFPSSFWLTSGGRAACSDIRVQLPLNIADRVRYPAAVVERVRHLARRLADGQIADCLNQEGQVSALGKPFTASIIQWIRYRYQIPRAVLERPEEWTVHQVA